MPLYDFSCTSCESIFEARVSLAQLGLIDVVCPGCEQVMPSKPMVTARPSLFSVEPWRAQSKAEQLVGARAGGPGAYLGAKRSSVLHQCRGGICSLCS
jgi:putative FmdB family regulatory protein